MLGLEQKVQRYGHPRDASPGRPWDPVDGGQARAPGGADGDAFRAREHEPAHTGQRGRLLQGSREVDDRLLTLAESARGYLGAVPEDELRIGGDVLAAGDDREMGELPPHRPDHALLVDPFSREHAGDADEEARPIHLLGDLVRGEPVHDEGQVVQGSAPIGRRAPVDAHRSHTVRAERSREIGEGQRSDGRNGVERRP